MKRYHGQFLADMNSVREALRDLMRKQDEGLAPRDIAAHSRMISDLGGILEAMPPERKPDGKLDRLAPCSECDVGFCLIEREGESILEVQRCDNCSVLKDEDEAYVLMNFVWLQYVPESRKKELGFTFRKEEEVLRVCRTNVTPGKDPFVLDEDYLDGAVAWWHEEGIPLAKKALRKLFRRYTFTMQVTVDLDPSGEHEGYLGKRVGNLLASKKYTIDMLLADSKSKRVLR